MHCGSTTTRWSTCATCRVLRLGRCRAAAERVDPGLESLIDGWHLTPAYVQGWPMNVLAANPLARALNPHWTPGTNQLRTFFLQPEAPELVRNWEGVGAVLVSWMRFLVARHSTDSQLQSLVGELSCRQPTIPDVVGRP